MMTETPGTQTISSRMSILEIARRLNIGRQSARGLYRDPQLDAIIGRVHEVLLRAQVPFRCLDRRVPKEQLDLLQLAPGGPAEPKMGGALADDEV